MPPGTLVDCDVQLGIPTDDIRRVHRSVEAPTDAADAGPALLTRDSGRYAVYFPTIEPVTPPHRARPTDASDECIGPVRIHTGPTAKAHGA